MRAAGSIKKSRPVTAITEAAAKNNINIIIQVRKGSVKGAS
nr:MAG TPA: hypothetical protein [Caudoviricetes sp.]